MILNLIRYEISENDKAAIGKISIDGVFECYSLEDRVRPHKIPGETAIPAGAYRVVIDFSNRFQRFMPHILDVPNFTGIRIHPGNTDQDTHGCILVGQTHNLQGQDYIGQSRLAFDALFAKLEAARARGEEVSLVITDEFENQLPPSMVAK